MRFLRDLQLESRYTYIIIIMIIIMIIIIIYVYVIIEFSFHYRTIRNIEPPEDDSGSLEVVSFYDSSSSHGSRMFISILLVLNSNDSFISLLLIGQLEKQ